METFLIRAAQLILSLSILVVLHELGHFIPAKLFKMRVEKFYLFFDVKFSLFKKKIGETIYGIGWLPLGGYVKIAGMIDESMDKEQMAQPPKPWEFRSKPAWQRLIVMIGGVTVNLLLGFFIYAMILFVWGEKQVKEDGIKNGFAVSNIMKSYGFQNGDIVTEVNGKPLENLLDINRYVMLRNVNDLKVKSIDGKIRHISLPDSIGKQLFHQGEMIAFSPRVKPVMDSILPELPAAKAGFKKGDKIVSINDININFYDDVQAALAAFPKESPLVFQVERNGTQQRIEVTPNKDGKIGFMPKQLVEIKTVDKKYDFASALAAGISYGYWTLRDYIAQFKFVFTKKGASELGGFGAIGKMFPPAWDWKAFWHTTAFISIMLAFMNILPIPALDGGHVMFLLYEMITGRKPSEKVMEYAQIVGFFLLIALVLYANGNDIYKAVLGKF
ncbi:RIP metalloprotease RseP [Capnocytophaga sp.]|uniref:RIP metalloprotease RseP n=1 Tax=Capnocytophaga sp. TaxID=44737 RepID=UPI0026DC3A11|nr:RIP metalloprotease RseP [Capnocytophaga sp.]MDO5105771.1 RIP metalloprotease RseP [Capnocytophaga sp.]